MSLSRDRMRDPGGPGPLNLVVARKAGIEVNLQLLISVGLKIQTKMFFLQLGPDGEPRRKKMRTTFTGRQIFELERMFETKKYLNSGERSHLSR